MQSRIRKFAVEDGQSEPAAAFHDQGVGLVGLLLARRLGDAVGSRAFRHLEEHGQAVEEGWRTFAGRALRNLR